MEKIDGCKDIPENLSTTKVGEYIPSGFSVATISSFKSIENNRDACTDTDCMKFCKSLREHAMEIINFKKKKLNSSTNERQKSNQNAKICYMKNVKINMLKLKSQSL